MKLLGVGEYPGKLTGVVAVTALPLDISRLCRCHSRRLSWEREGCQWACCHCVRLSGTGETSDKKGSSVTVTQRPGIHGRAVLLSKDQEGNTAVTSRPVPCETPFL